MQPRTRHNTTRWFWLFCLLLIWGPPCLLAQPLDRTPEQATGRTSKRQAAASSFMVSTANPYASQVAYRTLKRGGSAADATVAAAMVLTLTEPQSSGLGGGGFILHWDQQNNRLQSFDGRETAPQSAQEDLFLAQGRPLGFLQAVAGGRAVGTPGLLQSLFLLHSQHGKLLWADLFSEAIRLAEEGFEVSARLAAFLQNPTNRARLQRNPDAAAYFFPEGKALKAGQLRKNPQLGLSLRWLAHTGTSAFYRGQIAREIVRAVQQDENPGSLSLSDLARYQALEREPVCGPYAGYRVCSMGPPSSGGVTLLQILGLLEQTDIARHPPLSRQAIHLFAQAAQLAFADRNRYLADSDFVPVPLKGLLDRGYLQQRARLIDRHKNRGNKTAGTPPGSAQNPRLEGQNLEQPGTSHLSIVDSAGNAVAMTASIEQAFGSGIMVRGFLLNNELTDFSFRARGQTGELIANRVQGGKRPRSSMTPTMVFDQKHRLKLVIGSPGGSRIIPYVAQTLLGVLSWKMSIQQAIDQPHHLHRNGKNLDLERGTALTGLKAPLEALGYRVEIRTLNSGLHGILLTEKGLQGGADPRREGLVLGD